MLACNFMFLCLHLVSNGRRTVAKKNGAVSVPNDDGLRRAIGDLIDALVQVTPAIAGGLMFVRTFRKLICLGKVLAAPKKG